MKIAIIGTGYVGLVTGACLAEAGHEVNCVDVDRKKIRALQKSIVPFYEPGLSKISKTQQANKNLSFTSSYQKALKNCEAIFLCVGTPPKKNGHPNLSFLNQSLESLAKNINHPAIIFIKSTVPVGTNKYAEAFFKKISRNKNAKITFASNPEFLKEGAAVQDFKKPDRIVIGTENNEVVKISKAIYRKFSKKNSLLYFCKIESAELIKYASNAFLATKISFINEISRLSDSVNADIQEIQTGIGLDKRIGSQFLNAGLGFGGSCFPKDLDGLITNFKNAGLSAEISIAAKKVNSMQVTYFFKKIQNHINLKNLNIMIWGLSFKPETDDVRESVSIKLIKKIAEIAQTIYTYDPEAIENAKKELAEFDNIKYLSNKYECIENCDILILATEWNEFKDPSIRKLQNLKQKMVFDGRNSFSQSLVDTKQIKYIGIGRK